MYHGHIKALQALADGLRNAARAALHNTEKNVNRPEIGQSHAQSAIILTYLTDACLDAAADLQRRNDEAAARVGRHVATESGKEGKTDD